MDDLFNKAGRHYPLKTDGADWNAVAQRLSEQTPPPPNTPNNHFPYGWLALLLVPVLFLVIKKNDPGATKQSPKQIIENTSTKHNGAGSKNVSIKEKGKVSARASEKTKPDAKGQNKSKDDDGQAVGKPVFSKTDADKIVTKEKEGAAFNGTGQNNNPAVEKPATKSPKLVGDRLTKQRSLTPASESNEHLAAASPSITSLDHQHSVSGLSNLRLTKKEALATEQSGTRKGKPGRKLADAIEEDIFGRSLLLGPSWNSLAIGDRTALFNSDLLSAVTDAMSPAKSSLKPDGYFYYGITMAPDLSFIKSQAVKNIGYNLGVLVGYHFENRLSIEGAFLWDRKKYYSAGKYFDKARAGIPSYVWIKWVDGGCDMFEIPIAVRYDFSSNASTFFASAGFNSYFMRKEKYTYAANTIGGYYQGNRTYNNSGNHWLASLALTAGYSIKVMRNTNIRFEPYYKIPLKKIGTGNMPLTSTGINLSLVQRIP